MFRDLSRKRRGNHFFFKGNVYHTMTTASTAPVDSTTTVASLEKGEYQLKKRRPGCTGMFWRSDPTGATQLTSNSENWPRDDALLRGKVIECNGKMWLLVDEVKQAEANSTWQKAPVGAALPFEYDDHYYLE